MAKIAPERVQEIGVYLYGPRDFVKKLAAKYGNTPRAVRYWLVGQKIPDWLEPALEDAYARQIAETGGRVLEAEAGE